MKSPSSDWFGRAVPISESGVLRTQSRSNNFGMLVSDVSDG